MNKRLKGVFAPITTPFTKTGRLITPALKRTWSSTRNRASRDIWRLGSNGENKSLMNDEKVKVLKTIVDNKGKDQFVMAGCIFESTYETIQYAKEYEKLGADFLTLLPPSYFKKQMTDPVLIKVLQRRGGCREYAVPAVQRAAVLRRHRAFGEPRKGMREEPQYRGHEGFVQRKYRELPVCGKGPDKRHGGQRGFLYEHAVHGRHGRSGIARERVPGDSKRSLQADTCERNMKKRSRSTKRY